MSAIQPPYELIGKAVVFILAMVLVLAIAATIVLALGFVWVRGWTAISNFMWRGYDPHDTEYPPLWKLRVSGVTVALAPFKFNKILPAYREAEELADDDVTVNVWLRRYVKSMFLDD